MKTLKDNSWSCRLLPALFCYIHTNHLTFKTWFVERFV